MFFPTLPKPQNPTFLSTSTVLENSEVLTGWTSIWDHKPWILLYLVKAPQRQWQTWTRQGRFGVFMKHRLRWASWQVTWLLSKAGRCRNNQLGWIGWNFHATRDVISPQWPPFVFRSFIRVLKKLHFITIWKERWWRNPCLCFWEYPHGIALPESVGDIHQTGDEVFEVNAMGFFLKERRLPPASVRRGAFFRTPSWLFDL